MGCKLSSPCLLLLLAVSWLATLESAHAVVISRFGARPQVSCSLSIVGYGNGKPGVATVSFNCDSPLTVGINGTYLLSRHVLSFSNVRVETELECQSLSESNGTYALLYLCGDVNLVLLDLQVEDLQIPGDPKMSWRTRIVAFGGHIKAVISNARLHNNQATSLLGITMNAELVLEGGSKITSNQVGSALWMAGTGSPSLTVIKSMISDNAVYSCTVRAYAGARLLFKESTISNNTATGSVLVSGGGAAACLYENARLQVVNSTISYNTAGNESVVGAVAAAGSARVDIVASTFTSNFAMYGGAVAAFENATLHVHRSTFFGNGARFGGAIYLAGSASARVDIVASTFTSSFATYGAAVAVYENAMLHVERSTFLAMMRILGVLSSLRTLLMLNCRSLLSLAIVQRMLGVVLPLLSQQ